MALSSPPCEKRFLAARWRLLGVGQVGRDDIEEQDLEPGVREVSGDAASHHASADDTRPSDWLRHEQTSEVSSWGQGRRTASRNPVDSRRGSSTEARTGEDAAEVDRVHPANARIVALGRGASRGGRRSSVVEAGTDRTGQLTDRATEWVSESKGSPRRELGGRSSAGPPITMRSKCSLRATRRIAQKSSPASRRPRSSMPPRRSSVVRAWIIAAPFGESAKRSAVVSPHSRASRGIPRVEDVNRAPPDPHGEEGGVVERRVRGGREVARNQDAAARDYGSAPAAIDVTTTSRTASVAGVRSTTSLSGSRSVNVVPRPTVVSSSTDPPWRCAHSRTRVSPSPVPPAPFVLKKGSKFAAGRPQGFLDLRPTR